jgi:uncharacterized LabA/DUF88 family protein
MARTVVFIDGENFMYKVEDALTKSGHKKDKINFSAIDLSSLVKNILRPQTVDEIIYYGAKLHLYKDSREKSEELIKKQRSLKTALEKQGVHFIVSGNVRAQKFDGKTVFREKGVDVRLAVDIVKMSCDRQITTAVLCSSDSDLQPAIAEAKNRGVQTIYLGFASNPNKGLTATCDKTLLLKTPEIKASLGL